MARMPASAIRAILRLTGRGDGGACGPTRSGPSAMDLENKRLRLNFMAPIRLLEKHSKILAGAGLHLRHGYFRYSWRLWRGFAALLWRGSERPGRCYGRAKANKETIMAERLSAEARKSALQGLPGWSEAKGGEAI